MAKIVFYQKMDCVNNGKQKKIFLDAGNDVECVDILLRKWATEELEGFFEGKPIEDCFNYTAPAVRDGEIDPKALSRKEALELMARKPILIKRPLIEVDGMKIQGFKDPRVMKYCGSWKGDEDVTTCPKLAQKAKCGDPE